MRMRNGFTSEDAEAVRRWMRMYAWTSRERSDIHTIYILNFMFIFCGHEDEARFASLPFMVTDVP